MPGRRWNHFSNTHATVLSLCSRRRSFSIKLKTKCNILQSTFVVLRRRTGAKRCVLITSKTLEQSYPWNATISDNNSTVNITNKFISRVIIYTQRVGRYAYTRNNSSGARGYPSEDAERDIDVDPFYLSALLRLIKMHVYYNNAVVCNVHSTFRGKHLDGNQR